MSIRNQDNFTDSKQYILEQLFVMNYNNTEDFNNLKMKLWVLDGPIRNEEGITDEDVNNPVNHWETLLNDLTYLDRYVKTEDGTLGEREKSFNEFWDQRIKTKERFIAKEENEPWDQPYNQRPTLLSKSDFTDLYNEFVIKRTNGELETAFDIVYKITNYCIDIESKQAEQAVETHVPADELEEQLKDNAEGNKDKNDINYVNEMRDIHDELWGMMEWLRDSFDLPEPEEPEEGEPPPPPYENSRKIIANMPEKRQQVSIENTSTHKGIIIEDMNTGGYRFVFRDSDGNETSIPVTPSATQNFSLSPNKLGQLEKTWADIKWCTYYEQTNGITTAYLSQVKSKDDLPSGANTPNAITLQRFNELNSRWININNLREFQISNMGTRAIIESMVTATIPELSDDKVAHFDTKKNQKEFYTSILKEKRGEFN
jgi:hypothetical protein